MNPLVAAVMWAGPLADATLLDSIRGALTAGPRTHETLAVLGGAAMFIAIIAVLARYTGAQKDAKGRAPRDLLRSASDVLGLSDQERRDLDEIARRAARPCPSAMLLSPLNLAIFTERAVRDARDPALERRAHALCRKLFGVRLPRPQATPGDGA